VEFLQFCTKRKTFNFADCLFLRFQNLAVNFFCTSGSDKRGVNPLESCQRYQIIMGNPEENKS
jgi:hypothetical protein